MFPSKIILFGEYTVLLNSLALAIPYYRFKGKWAYINNDMDFNRSETINSNRNLRKFLFNLRSLANKPKPECILDFHKFEEDLEKGLYFRSDIPMGVGLGSSGALVAAVFDRYVKNQTVDSNISKLKECLALLESYYHVNSSGIDPLVSYLKSPVLQIDKEKIEIHNSLVERALNKYGLFLVDSQYVRNTGKLVDYFKNTCHTNIEYLLKIQKDYIPVNNACIQEFILQNHTEIFFSKIKALTQLQLQLFKEMIPEPFLPLMVYGMENDLFYLKLCGSGGGGYFLGFTNDTLKTKQYFKLNGYHALFF